MGINMNVNTIPPININGVNISTDDTKDASFGVISGAKSSAYNETNTITPQKEKEPDLKALSPDDMTVQIIGYNPKGFLAAQEKRSDEATKVLDSYIQNIVQSKNAKDQFAQVSSDIAQERPDLVYKKWDFSLNARDDIVIMHNGDLTDEDVNWLQDRLQYSGLKEALAELKSSMITLVESERGSDMYSTNIGRYDISEANFDQIIHFGEFLNKTNGEDANQILTSQLAVRADDPYKNLTYEFLVVNEHLTNTKPVPYSPENK